jgi:prepilin-type N-terminal cleavage/methylation domain-containing protein
MNRPARRGFTLIELLVVITIIGILLGMMLPAVQACREAAHRATCASNLCQIGIGLQSYESAQGVLPPGTIEPKGPIHNMPQGYHIGWLVQLLPYIEENVTYKNVDFVGGAYSKKNAPLRAIHVGMFVCPSDPGRSPALGVSNYAGCYNDVESPIDTDNNGVFFLNSHVSAKDVTDGVSHTIYVGEKLSEPGDLGWMSGTRATLRNTGSEMDFPLGSTTKLAADRLAAGAKPEATKGTDKAGATSGPAAESPTSDLTVGGFGSAHVVGCNFLFGDGAVRFVRRGITTALLQQLGNRADGKLLEDGPTRAGW